jgi:hypothetical protein
MKVGKKPERRWAMEEITVVIGHRGGGQLLGAFTDKKKIKALQELTKEYRQEGYVSFLKVKVNEFQVKRYGLYFK